LPFPDQSFDFVTAVETLEHLRKVEHVIAEMSRVLRPGGLCYISAPTRNVWPEYDETHVTILSRPEWAARLSQVHLIPLGRRRHVVLWTVFDTYFSSLRREDLPRPLQQNPILGRLAMASYLAYLNWSSGMVWATGSRHAHILAERR
jgi:SAM-dependent methyltransferase